MRIVQDTAGKLTLMNEDSSKSLDWSVSVFEKTRFNTVDDPFREINSYWAWLTPSRREKIWEIYQKIWTIFQDFHAPIDMFERSGGDMIDLDKITSNVTSLVEELYELMPLHEVDTWLQHYGRIKYPDNLKEVLDSDDISPDKTYLRTDYHGLVVLTVGLRPMVPIWGEYVNYIKKEVGTSYKEFYSLNLISKTHLVNSAPMLRLQRYIEANIPRDTDTAAAIIKGLPSSQLPDWLLALVLVRRLALGEVDAAEDRGSIISNVYGFISRTLMDLDKKFGGVREKYPEKDGDDGDDGSSKLEFFKMKEPLTAAQRQTVAVYTEFPVQMAKHLDPTIPESLVERCMELSFSGPLKPFQDVQKRVIQLTLRRLVSPKAILSLNRNELTRAAVVVQAALIHWGFDLIAALLAARPYENGETVYTSQGRAKMSPATFDKLSEIYPWFQEGGNRKTNIGVASIQKMVTEWNSQSWLPTTPLNLYDGNLVKLNSIRCLELQPGHDQPTLGEQLARLAIRVNSET